MHQSLLIARALLMATSTTRRAQFTRCLLLVVIFAGFASSCTSSKTSSRPHCLFEEWVNSTSVIDPRKQMRQTTRQCILSLLSDAIASRAETTVKRSEDWPPFQRISLSERLEETPNVVSMDKALPHVPLEALGGLLGATFTSKPMEIDCPENFRHRHKPAVLLSAIKSDWYVSSSPCAARVAVDPDPNRWPQSLLRVECACEEERCSSRGPHSCITVSAPVTVLRRRVQGEGWRLLSEPVSVGCICASRRARVMRQSRPNLVRR